MFTLALLGCIWINPIIAQNTFSLEFKQNKEFKILQLTDLHWNDTEKENNKKNIQLLNYLVKAENPDLILFTGDVVVDPPILKGWQNLGKVMEKLQKPWAAVMGNHDTEERNKFTRMDIHQYINQLPYYISSEQLENYQISSFVIPISNYKSTEISHLLYCIDSKDYAKNQDYSHYAWIELDQINWYRKNSNQHKKNNYGEYIHSLAFFHIPLPEYNLVKESTTLLGQFKEGPSSASLNSGLFCNMLEQGDIKGIFVGHDHENDFISIYKGIALGYGRVSGYGAYGNLSRGGRIIKLYEGQKRFDSWIHDIENGVSHLYYYPSGISAEEEDNMNYLSAKKNEKTNIEQGLNYHYYEARYKSVNQIDQKDFVKKGTVNNFSLDITQRPDSFAIAFDGYIEILEKGIYDFYIKSDDGSQLFIDNKLIVDNDGSHSARLKSGRVALESGLHTIRVLYFEDYMGEELNVYYSNKKQEKIPIPNNVLYHNKNKK